MKWWRELEWWDWLFIAALVSVPAVFGFAMLWSQ